MKWLLRLVLLVVVPTLVVAVAGAAWVFNVKYTHPRNADAFIERLDNTYPADLCQKGTKACNEPVSSFAPIEDEFLIAEGDRACDWLAEQPYPWLSQDPRFALRGLVARYKKENPAARNDWTRGRLRPADRDVVVTQAWDDLCGAEWTLREPRTL